MLPQIKKKNKSKEPPMEPEKPEVTMAMKYGNLLIKNNELIGKYNRFVALIAHVSNKQDMEILNIEKKLSNIKEIVKNKNMKAFDKIMELEKLI